MKKILYITYRYPYPLTDGSRIRQFNIGKILAKKYKVDLFALNDGYGYNMNDLKLGKVFDNLEFFPFTKIRGNINVLKSLLNDKPLQVNSFFLKEVFNKFKKMIFENDYDTIFCSHVRTAEYARPFQISKFLDFIDCQSAHYEEASERNVNFLWNQIYKMELKRLKNYEMKMVEEFDKTFVTSPYDSEKLKVKPTVKPLVIPNGVKPELLKRKNKFGEENWIVFLGKMDYNPNVDAVKYFTSEVLPLLSKKIKFYIVGTNPSKEVLRLQSDRIKVTGFVEDPYEYLEKAKVVVAPIRFSGGIQNKVLEAMALGRPVVTTSNCARSISPFLAFADEPKEMAYKINHLLEDESSRIYIGKQYKNIIKEKFTWDKVGEKLLKEVKI